MMVRVLISPHFLSQDESLIVLFYTEVMGGLFFLFFLFFGLFAISWAVPAAYGGSQARGRIGAIAAGLHQSHSNSGSELHLQPTPQLTATLDH